MYKVLVENGLIVKDLSNTTEPIVKKGQAILIIEQSPYTVDEVFRELTSVELLPATLKQWKENRQSMIDSLSISYNAIEYQADEASQDRINRAINGLFDDTTIIQWKAKDNSKQNLTRIDLKNILALAVQEQTRIWFADEPIL